MIATKNEKKLYYILSGEGLQGTWSVYYGTFIGLHRKIAKERCNGDRWVYVYDYCAKRESGVVVKMVFDYAYAEPYRFLPGEIYKLGQDLLAKNKKNK